MLSDVTFHVSGLPSPAKTKLIAALDEQIAGVARADAVRIHIHAESDLEAMLEGPALATLRAQARTADIVIPVDWEPVARSVTRVLATLSRKVDVKESA